MSKSAVLLLVCSIALACVDARFDFNSRVERLSSGWGPEEVNQHSGYISVNKKDEGAHIFFWAFESRNEPTSDPLVLWMTGGPGCSSELAVFYEQGPYRISKNGDVSLNEHAWNNNATVIFVDQPVGTGFSYADNSDDYVVNEHQVGQDMFEFMQTFYEQFPQYKALDFYVTGESYAGHYVPAVGNRIYQGIKNNEGFKIPLKGLAIGNGMVQASEQYPAYLPYAEEKKLITSRIMEKIVQGETDLCSDFIAESSPVAAIVCNSIVMTLEKVGNDFNVYDVREKCAVQPLCYDFSPLDKLMSRADVQRSLGVSPKASWTECSSKVYAYLQKDWFTDCSSFLPELLENGIKVLVYHGMDDFICNYKGGLAWSEKMAWSGQAEYNNGQFSDWLVEGTKAGKYKSASGLIFLEVDNAGHMVPMNQPANALAMLVEFTSESSFKSQARSPRVVVNHW